MHNLSFLFLWWWLWRLEGLNEKKDSMVQRVKVAEKEKDGLEVINLSFSSFMVWTLCSPLYCAKWLLSKSWILCYRMTEWVKTTRLEAWIWIWSACLQCKDIRTMSMVPFLICAHARLNLFTWIKHLKLSFSILLWQSAKNEAENFMLKEAELLKWKKCATELTLQEASAEADNLKVKVTELEDALKQERYDWWSHVEICLSLSAVFFINTWFTTASADQDRSHAFVIKIQPARLQKASNVNKWNTSWNTWNTCLNLRMLQLIEFKICFGSMWALLSLICQLLHVLNSEKYASHSAEIKELEKALKKQTKHHEVCDLQQLKLTSFDV